MKLTSLSKNLFVREKGFRYTMSVRRFLYVITTMNPIKNILVNKVWVYTREILISNFFVYRVSVKSETKDTTLYYRASVRPVKVYRVITPFFRTVWKSVIGNLRLGLPSTLGDGGVVCVSYKIWVVFILSQHWLLRLNCPLIMNSNI